MGIIIGYTVVYRHYVCTSVSNSISIGLMLNCTCSWNCTSVHGLCIIDVRYMYRSTIVCTSLCVHACSMHYSPRRKYLLVWVKFMLEFDSGVTVTTLKLEPSVSAGVSRLKHVSIRDKKQEISNRCLYQCWQFTAYGKVTQCVKILLFQLNKYFLQFVA